jgi:hypothetical protein
LRADIRSGHARPEQKTALCTGGASVSPEDRVELLTVLALDPDSQLSERALGVLMHLPAESFLTALAREDADPRLFAYCAQNFADKPGIADALAKNLSCPTPLVTRVAAHLTTDGIQALLDNLERFTADPQLVVAVTQIAPSNTEQRELLADLQQTAVATIDIEDIAAEIEPDPGKRETLMQQVTKMTVVQRLTLALKGGRSERSLLIRDSNKLVQRCVLQSPRLTDSEVEAYASMTNLSKELLRQISMTRKFMKNYITAKNLVCNSKTPLDISLHLLPRLNATDLRILTTNKNIPETLRSSALKLHRKRKAGGT